MKTLHKPRTSIAAAAVGLSLLLASPLAAQGQEREVTDAQKLAQVLTSATIVRDLQDGQEEGQPELVTRVYSLRPLIQAADHAQQAGAPAMADIPLIGRLSRSQQMGGIAGELAAVPGAAAPTPMATQARSVSDTVPQVIDLILTSVEPDSWVDNGGELGQITFLPVHASLVVTHTAAVQSRVAELLGAIQDRRVVSARARLVQAAGDQIEAIVRLEQGVAVVQGEVSHLPVIAQVRYSGFEGQNQSVTDGRSVPYVASVTPVVAANAVGYQSQVAEIKTGLTLNITPVLSEDGNQVTLQVRAEYVLLDESAAGAAGTPTTPNTRPAERATPLSELAVGGEVMRPDLMAVDRRALDLSVRIPAGQWVLVGSMGSSRDGSPTSAEPLHLLIRIDTGSAE